MDEISKQALKALMGSEEPLETKEVAEEISKHVENVTRTKLFSRLNILWGKGLIKGKFVGPGKGVWIWWKAGTFSKEVRRK